MPHRLGRNHLSAPRALTWCAGIGVIAASLGCNPTREIEYTEDKRIDGAEGSANDPDSFGTKMCVSKEGSSATIYVLFMDNRNQPDEERYDIWLNRSVDLGQNWLPAPIKVNQGDGSNVWNPDLYCNELGVFVVWEDDRDGDLRNHQIYFNASTDGGETFLPEDILLEEDANGDTMSLEPKIEGYGPNLYVVWYDNANGAYDILVSSSSDAGASWRDPARVDSDNPGAAYSARPELALGRNADDIWVVWEDSRDDKADIYFAHSDNGGVDFGDDERLDEGDADGSNDSFEPQLCADETGNVYAVWHDARNGDGRDIFMNYSYDKGETWLGTALRLDSNAPGLGNSLFPVCVAEGNTLHVAWHDKREPELGYDIYYRKVVAGLPGEAEIRLDAGTPEGYANSVGTRIASDGATVMVAWQDARGEVEAGTENNYDDLYYNYTDNGTAFSPDADYRIDSMYDGRSFKVDLDIAVIGGSWYAAWTDGRGGTSDIYFQTFPLGEEAKPLPLEALDENGGG